MSPPRRKPDPPRKSRSITLAILGAVTLCSCCCCLAPAPRGDEAPAGDSEGGDFGGPQEFAADGTPVPGTGTNQATHTTHSRPFYGGPFWLPLFFGGGGGSSYRGGSGVNSPSRTQSPGAGAPGGGFGGTGRAMSGTGGGGSSS